MGIFTEHERQEKAEAESDARHSAHLSRIEASLLEVDASFRAFTSRAKMITGSLGVFTVITYVAAGICFKGAKRVPQEVEGVVGPAFIIAHVAWFLWLAYYLTERKKRITRHWCSLVEQSSRGKKAEPGATDNPGGAQ